MSRFSQAVNRFEESVLAILLATITLVSFAQVIARYGFNTGWTGALEFNRILFAWMILFGMSYGVKIGTHLGVDAIIRLFPRPLFRTVAIFGALCGVLYAAILLYSNWLQLFGAETKGGAIDYWMKMYKIGIGLDDLRYPEWVRTPSASRNGCSAGSPISSCPSASSCSASAASKRRSRSIAVSAN